MRDIVDDGLKGLAHERLADVLGVASQEVGDRRVSSKERADIIAVLYLPLEQCCYQSECHVVMLKESDQFCVNLVPALRRH